MMNPAEFEKKLNLLPEEQPDAIDLAMLAEAAKINDGSAVSLEQFQRSVEDYSGKLNIRIPRSLHRELKKAAEIEGVSLNQYMLYKLAK